MVEATQVTQDTAIDRNVQVYNVHTGNEVKASQLDIPESFYELSANEAKMMMAAASSSI